MTKPEILFRRLVVSAKQLGKARRIEREFRRLYLDHPEPHVLREWLTAREFVRRSADEYANAVMGYHGPLSAPLYAVRRKSQTDLLPASEPVASPR